MPYILFSEQEKQSANASDMVEHGTDPETVKAVLGHESIKTTNRYLHPYEDGMRKASGTMESIIRGVANDKTTVCASGSA